jgi:hypothetical protein
VPSCGRRSSTPGGFSCNKEKRYRLRSRPWRPLVRMKRNAPQSVTNPMSTAIARDVPMPSRNNHTHTANASAQRNEDTPGATLGDRRCTRRSYTAPGTINSPSRWRFRPPTPLTFRFRVVPSKSDSTYFRSVLGAVVNLLGGQARGNRSRRRKRCNLHRNVLHTFHTAPAGLWSAGLERARACSRGDEHENEHGDRQPIDDEERVRVAPDVVEQDPDGREAGDGGGDHADDERTG